jgi:hypothetical protein
MLCALLSSKNKLTDWLQLLHHPLFQKNLGVSQDEARSVREWLKNLPISWGLSQTHCEQYLQLRGIESRGKKEGTFAAEKEALIAIFFNEPDHFFSCSDIPGRAAFFHLLSQVEEYVLPQRKQEPFSYWRILFQTLSQISMSDEDGYEEAAITEALDSFKEIEVMTGETAFSWEYIQSLFFQLIDAAYDQTAIDLRAPMIVAEFGRFQPFPADVIAILGAQDGELPRYSQERLLTQLHKMAQTLPSSNAFLDRYGIIEAILSAKSLFIGYQAYDFATKEAVLPSSSIIDIFTHLDDHYRIDEQFPSKALTHHHDNSRPNRFEEKEKDFPLIALKKDALLHVQAVDPKALKKVAKSPLEVFYKAKLGYVSSFKDENTLFVKPWEVKHCLEEQDASSWESQEIIRVLRVLNADSPLYDVLLLPTAVDFSIDYEKKQFVCPIIQCGAFEICGIWPSLRKEGTVLLNEDWKKELFRLWPEQVFRAYVAQEYGVPLHEKIILIEEGKVLSIDCQVPHTVLQEWASFALAAVEHPFPFTFEIVKKLLSESDDVLASIQSHAQKVSGEWRFIASEDTRELLSLWTAWARRLYSSFFSAVESL